MICRGNTIPTKKFFFKVNFKRKKGKCKFLYQRKNNIFFPCSVFLFSLKVLVKLINYLTFLSDSGKMRQKHLWLFNKKLQYSNENTEWSDLTTAPQQRKELRSSVYIGTQSKSQSDRRNHNNLHNRRIWKLSYTLESYNKKTNEVRNCELRRNIDVQALLVFDPRVLVDFACAN